MNHGRDSGYYQLYRKSPALARKALWRIYKESGGCIRLTARKAGCSRNTVKALLRRLRSGEILWSNRPSKQKTSPCPRKQGREFVVFPRAFHNLLSDSILKPSLGVVLIRKS